MTKRHDPTSRRRTAVMLIALLLALAPNLTACVGAEEELPGDEDGASYFPEDEPLGKADSAGVPGPAVSTWTADTQVWTAKNKWEDTDTPAARAAGMAWSADSGLNWDQKYARWIESMQRTDGHDTYYETFTLVTPWGKQLPAPKLECAEMAMFLRITFAAWYQLPFYMTTVDGSGTRVYFGHFGARTTDGRYKNTPKYGYSYKDYSDWSTQQLDESGWPQDAGLRKKGMYGGGDDMPFLGEGAKIGTYLDEIHLNKRVGHFTTLLLAYFGSMHLAGSRNTYNLKPEAVREGDVLIERWQRKGIGHTLVVKEVIELAGGQLEAQLASGSMPRRQPKWEDGVASKHYFVIEETGGPGENYEGDEYVKLGGGLKRWRVTKNINGYWTNTWMATDEANWISDTDYDTLKARQATFEQILGEAPPEQMRDALLGMIEDARNHLRQYPASCSARIKREDAFADLYELMQSKFNTSAAQVDSTYRTFEDYVFAKLEYTESKTCCWNSTTAAMFQIIMDYNQSLQQDQCSEPVVFKCTGGGYEVFADYAAATERGHLWKPWSEDETCAQRNVLDDTIVESTELGWCEVESAGGGGGGDTGGCSDDGYEDNDSDAAASSLGGGDHNGLMVCSGDDDYYRIDVPSGSTLTVTAQFDHDSGDLDVALYKDGSEVDSSTSVSDTETVQASGGASYVVRVYGYQGAQAAYALSVSMQ